MTTRLVRVRLLGGAFAACLALPAAVAAQAPQPPAQAPQPPAQAPQPPTVATPEVRGDETAPQREPTVSREAGTAIAQQAPAHISLRLTRGDDGGITVGTRTIVIGRLRPFVPAQRVAIRFQRNGKTIAHKRPFVRQVRDRNIGEFRMRSPKLIRPGDYRFFVKKPRTQRQAGAQESTRSFGVDYPDLDPGARSDAVRLFNDLLDRKGYHTSSGRYYSAATGRAVMAFRKVNLLSRNYNATPGIFKALAAGKGGFQLAYPSAGRHVEADISRQVMVLANHGKAKHIFHVSTGAPGTPSDRGHFRFFRREPGYNNKRMYYSVYYNGGEATHGYHSVPTYPASHGCIRNPISNSRFIYDWVELGMSIYVYD